MSALKKRMAGLLQRRDSDDVDDSASVVPLIKQWCRSASESDDLTALVQLTETIFSNPRQAQEGAKQIRKILAEKGKVGKGEVYNAQMLVSTLTRHQDSALFTKYIDDRFVGTIRGILRDETTPRMDSTKLLIRDIIVEYEKTIDGSISTAMTPAHTRAENQHRGARWATDAGVQRILELRKDPKNWRWLAQQQSHLQQSMPQQQVMGSSMLPTPQQQPTTLPGPHELSMRLHEADNTASILTQTIYEDPHGNPLTNILVQEFQTRCVGARNSLETYMRLTSDRPTLQNIDATKTKVEAALAQYNAAVRKHLSKPDSVAAGSAALSQPLQIAAPVATRAQPLQPAPNGAASPIDATAWQEDPFDDRHESRLPANASAHALNGTVDRPALSVLQDLVNARTEWRRATRMAEAQAVPMRLPSL